MHSLSWHKHTHRETHKCEQFDCRQRLAISNGFTLSLRCFCWVVERAVVLFSYDKQLTWIKSGFCARESCTNTYIHTKIGYGGDDFEISLSSLLGKIMASCGGLSIYLCRSLSLCCIESAHAFVFAPLCRNAWPNRIKISFVRISLYISIALKMCWLFEEIVKASLAKIHFMWAILRKQTKNWWNPEIFEMYLCVFGPLIAWKLIIFAKCSLF